MFWYECITLARCAQARAFVRFLGQGLPGDRRSDTVRGNVGNQ